jgi:hypothetical protein
MSIAAALLGVPLLVVTAWALVNGSFDAAIGFLTRDPWGIAITVDLYTGFALFGLLVGHVERSAARAAAWLLPALVLGNLVPAVYLALRLRHIVRRDAAAS